MEARTKNRKLPLWKLIGIQILLTGIVLCVFAVFHHVIPRVKLDREGLQPIGTVERQSTPTPAPTEQQGTETPESPAPTGTEETPEETPDPTPTPVPTPEPWSVRFGEHFSDEPVWEDYSYSSPSVSVTVTKYDHPESYPTLTYFVADVYISDVSCLKTGLSPRGSFSSPTSIAKDNGAIIAINGDSMLTQYDGFLIRNGNIYKQQPNKGDLCVMYYDGSMEIYSPGTYTVEEILEREPYQIWQFGPSLLDEEGKPLEQFNISANLWNRHPRTAIGYYEPGHYCLVVVDGRQGSYSDGADIETLASIMSDQGCVLAYNLDGGASTVMVFNGKIINRQSSERFLYDMVIITEPEETEVGSE